MCHIVLVYLLVYVYLLAFVSLCVLVDLLVGCVMVLLGTYCWHGGVINVCYYYNSQRPVGFAVSIYIMQGVQNLHQVFVSRLYLNT